jgi:hypothetical protein
MTRAWRAGAAAAAAPTHLTRDLMLLAVPYSSPSILFVIEIWLFGGRISEIIDVPLLRDRGRGE